MHTSSIVGFTHFMAVVAENEDVAWILALYADQIGDPVDQNPRLAGSWPCQNKDVGLFSIVGNDLLLNPIVQRLDDRPPWLPPR